MKEYDIECLNNNLKSFCFNQELILYYRDRIILFGNKEKKSIIKYIEKIKNPKEKLVCRHAYSRALIIIKNRKKLKLEKIEPRISARKSQKIHIIPKIEKGGSVNFCYTWINYYFYFLNFCIEFKIDYWYGQRTKGGKYGRNREKNTGRN